MPACRAATAFRICLSDSIGQYVTALMYERHVTVRYYSCAGYILPMLDCGYLPMLDCGYWSVYLLCLHSISYMCVFRSVCGLFSCAVLVGSS